MSGIRYSLPGDVTGDSQGARTGTPDGIEVPQGLESRITSWHLLSRWERLEVGRDLGRLGRSYGEIRQLVDVTNSTQATCCRFIARSDTRRSDG